MNTAELFAVIKESIAEAELMEPQAGDAFVKVPAGQLSALCGFLKSDPRCRFDFLRLITGVDTGAVLQSVYHLYSYAHQHALAVKVELDRNNPIVPSVTEFWPAANWLERECYDMLGIRYEGHPELRRILLPGDWEGHPLRKDYKEPESYHGLTHG